MSGFGGGGGWGEWYGERVRGSTSGLLQGQVKKQSWGGEASEGRGQGAESQQLSEVTAHADT